VYIKLRHAYRRTVKTEVKYIVVCPNFLEENEFHQDMVNKSYYYQQHNKDDPHKYLQDIAYTVIYLWILEDLHFLEDTHHIHYS